MDPILSGPFHSLSFQFPTKVNECYDPLVQLWDLEMKKCHARFEPAKFNLLSMKRLKATLDIALDIDSESSIAIQTCDTIIVVSLLVMEKWRRYVSLHGHA